MPAAANPGTGGVDPDLYARFRPRATRIVSIVLIVWVAGGWIAFLTLTQQLEQPPHVYQVGGGVLAAVICLFLYRQASVQAIPAPEGLLVRNVVRRRFLQWAQIINVRFGERDWVQLDLSDGHVLSVMAIQRVDGERAYAASRRLATLVARHEAGGVGSGGSGG